MDQNKLRGSLSDEEIAALRQRNEARAQEARKRLGRRWTCHPDNQAQKVRNQSILDSWSPV